MWMKSKTGMYHLVGDSTTIKGINYKLGVCQSYNLDRPNVLLGETVEEPPQGTKVCKKCLKSSLKLSR